MSRFISCRKTQRGDWLIFEAVPYTNGIGARKVGSPGQGYTTGHQFGRAEDENEACNSAKAIAQEMEMVLVPWEPPRDFNPRFIDLPPQNPTKKDYNSKDEAKADGWIYINPSKTIEHYRGRVIKCIDVTPGRSFGYNLAIKIAGQGRHVKIEEDSIYEIDQSIEFAKSQEIWANNRLSARFRTGDIVSAILAARKWIDQDLISIKEAVKLTGLSIHKISYEVRQENLTGYDTGEKRGRGRHGLMVSREQLKVKVFLGGK